MSDDKGCGSYELGRRCFRIRVCSACGEAWLDIGSALLERDWVTQLDLLQDLIAEAQRHYEAIYARHLLAPVDAA